ncbi:MAG TPA: hypothetical protein PLB89_12585 [Flavobacteriales bacterium]|nr:hypothetical protein [Flavobacteriales bacterium]
MIASTPHGLRRWFAIALLNLAIAAIIGCVLRSIYIVEIPYVNFKPLQQAHSHVAMLGWIFLALMVFLLEDADRDAAQRRHRTLFFWAQVAVVGMLLSFPVQGYGVVSIAFTTLHLLVSYGLAAFAWKGTSRWAPAGSRRLLRIAIGMQVLSTVGVWAMAPILTSGLFGSELYYWSIQFFLHFQFNGWFWFAALALWTRWAETHGAPQLLDPFTIRLWLVSAVLTFALAIAWSERHWPIIAINSLGVLLQLWAGWRTAKAIRHTQRMLFAKAPLWAWRCVTYALIFMALKVLIQTVVAVPPVAVIALTIRNYVIGFIHLNMLGAISMMLFAMALLRGWFGSTNLLVRIGLSLFTGGVLLSEAALFLQGTLFWAGQGMIPGYHWIQLLTSVPIPVGVVLLLVYMGRAASPQHASANDADGRM